MDLNFTPDDEALREQVRTWLEQQLTGPFAHLRGRGGPGEDHALVTERRQWERTLGEAGWTCVGWPREHGGRGLSLHQEVIFGEEYARARAPGRIGHIGDTLLGPTLIALGTREQQARFLPPIAAGEELWCQGYSEPNAGSDLASVSTRAERDGDEWVITGQKIWTSGAAWADWCFALCRTDPDAPKHKGLSYVLVPMKQAGVEIRPIVQMTGTSEFSEVFFDAARTAANNVVGEVNGGWRVALATLSFERGASTLGQQMAFAGEFDKIVRAAKRNGAASDPVIRQRLVDAWIGLKIMRLNALRMLSGDHETGLGREAMIMKLQWASWHRDLGELAMDVLGEESQLLAAAPYTLTDLQRLFLFSRADTIYAGSNQIQRNIIAERALGLPR
jgi:alkylation response protein AidB-like acyl-CoA dehydrogenase